MCGRVLNTPLQQWLKWFCLCFIETQHNEKEIDFERRDDD